MGNVLQTKRGTATQGSHSPHVRVCCVAFLCCLYVVATFAQSRTTPAVHAQSSSASQKNVAAAQAGRELYERNGCYECHGHEGQGGSAGKRLAPRPIAYPDFAQYCRRPTGEMPPYSAKLLNEADLASIYAFLQSIPEPPSSKSVPLLNPPAKKSGQ